MLLEERLPVWETLAKLCKLPASDRKGIYRYAVRRVHPDKNAHSGARDAFQRLEEAYTSG